MITRVTAETSRALTTRDGAHSSASRGNVAAMIDRLRAIALSALKRMYVPEKHLFCHHITCDSAGRWIRHGVSRRYTAMVLLGLADEALDICRDTLNGDGVAAVCDRLLDGMQDVQNLGDAAVTLWAARRLDHPAAQCALDRVRALDPCHPRHPVVEQSWALTALVCDSGSVQDQTLAEQIKRTLLAAYRESSRMFVHAHAGGSAGRLRRHVACFADLVYPVQALSYDAIRSGDTEAARVAKAAAQRMCELQGPHGQWWWHYDVRSGVVIEGYPVYAVHQDAMAPMALLAAAEATGACFDRAIERGLQWVEHAPEIGASLIDPDAGLIWRKVARREPGKLSRTAHAVMSAAHPRLRMPGQRMLFAPTRVDYESRPYHMGWILYAWSQQRRMRWRTNHAD